MSEKDSKSIAMTQAEIDESRQKIFGEQGLERVAGEGASTEVVPYPSDYDVVDGEFVETAGGGDEDKKSKTLPKWEQTLEAAKTPGVKGRDALLESARRQAQAALDLEEDTTEMLRIAEAINAIGEELVLPKPEGGKTGNRNGETGRVEIPKDEKSLRLLIRREARKVLSLSDDDSIGAGVVLDKIKLALPGYDPKERETIELFPRGIPNIDKIREEIIEELRARCELHNAQVKEGSYQGMKSTAALAKYVEDSEGNAFREISNGTFEWLKMVRERGDGLTAEKIDRAFSVLVWAGEGSAPVGFEPLFHQFEGFLGQVNIEGKVKNIYDDSYPKETQQKFLGKLAEMFGDDAADLAWQMFQGLRLEGEYKPSHYLFSVTHPAENRDFLATVFKVVIGSSRVLRDETADHHSFKDEIQRLAKLPLLARAKDEKTRNVKVDGLFMDRTNNGSFLRGSNFIDRGKLSVERTAVGQIKQASKVISAWIEIGKLGDKTSDKAGKVDGAVAQLVAIASALNELVDFGSITLADAEAQILIEAENIAWELSTRNEINMGPGQKKEDRKFLLPSGFNRLVNLVSKATLDGISAWPDGQKAVMLSDTDLKKLSEYVIILRKRSWNRLTSLPTLDPEKLGSLMDDEAREERMVLPITRGEMVMRRGEVVLQKQARALDEVTNRIRGIRGLPPLGTEN